MKQWPFIIAILLIITTPWNTVGEWQSWHEYRLATPAETDELNEKYFGEIPFYFLLGLHRPSTTIPEHVFVKIQNGKEFHLKRYTTRMNASIYIAQITCAILLLMVSLALAHRIRKNTT